MYSEFEFHIVRDGQDGDGCIKWPVPLHGGSIGRSPDCTWVLKDPHRVVSRLHAQVHIENSKCHWKDLGTNSTLVNGKPMPQNSAVTLNLGDVLRVGDYSMTLSKVQANWDRLDNLLVEPEMDVLKSLQPEASVNLNIDDLLATLDKPESQVDRDQELSAPVLAQRMYVGFQQAEQAAQQPANPQSAAVQAGPDAERLQYLLSLCVQGCMQLLSARRIFKEEMGSKLTSISDKGNNPLKFSASTAEAMSKLIGESSPAYLDAEQALEQAFQDIRVHMQLSVSRMQKLIEQVQEELDPVAIEQEINQRGGLVMNLEVARKARLWDLYCERYRQLAGTWS